MSSSSLTIHHLAKQCVARYGDREAVEDGRRTVTFAELWQEANHAARAMQRCGVGVGDRVLFSIVNSIEFVAVDLAIMLIGATKVAINPAWSSTELTDVIDKINPVLIVDDVVTQDKVLDAYRLAQSSAAVRNVSELIRPSEVLDCARVEVVTPDRIVLEDDIARISFTGGTTGRPKGVVYTQRAECLSMYAHMLEFGYSELDRNYACTPLSHAAGRRVISSIFRGSFNLIVEKFEVSSFVKALSENRITTTGVVPTMLYRILDQYTGDRRCDRFPSLRLITYGAAPILQNRLSEAIDTFGPVFQQNYGQTEVPNLISVLNAGDHDSATSPEVATCVGRPSIMAEVKIVPGDTPARKNWDDDSEVGEIFARAPYMMKEYLDDPQATANTVCNGWVKTGDIGRIDSKGFLHLLDRSKDMIITGGLNVYSTEVEQCISEVRGVASVAICGLEDSDWGEKVVAFIVRSADDYGQQLSRQSVIQWCKSRIAHYKCPKSVFFIEEMPLTLYGKIDKGVLTDRVDKC